MHAHPSLAYLAAEADALDLEAARIEPALASGGAAAAEAEHCIERAQQRLRAIEETEARTIGAVIREHLADPAGTPLAAGRRAWDEARADRRRLRNDLDRGADCTGDLQTYARHLHEAAAAERALAPWARRELGEMLLREADKRMEQERGPASDVAVDWGRFAA